MMKKIVFSIFGSALMLIIVSATTSTLSPCDSPLVGDHSGAPGETDCSGCHSSPVNPNVPELTFKVGSNETNYTPGKTYKVIVSIKRRGHDKFGFVCSSLDTLNISNGTFSLINSTTTRVFTENKKNYVSHTPCGADSKDSIQWSYNWTAPSVNMGKINLYMAMLVANHDHALTGDTTYTRVITLSPNLSGSINHLTQSEKAKVFPTIFTNDLNIEFNSMYENTSKHVLLINVEGKIIKELATSDSGIILSDNKLLPNGFYFLKITYKNASEIIKIIKQ